MFLSPRRAKNFASTPERAGGVNPRATSCGGRERNASAGIGSGKKNNPGGGRGRVTISVRRRYIRARFGSNLWHGSSPPVAVHGCMPARMLPSGKAGCFRHRERSSHLPGRKGSRVMTFAVSSPFPAALESWILSARLRSFLIWR